MAEHAFIITAYNDFSILKRGVKLYSKIGDVYIHIDKKARISEEDKNALLAAGNVEIISKYKIYWGSYKHILAVLALINRAKAKKDYSFYHILSGNTFLCAKKEDFLNFFSLNADRNFIEIIPVDDRIKERYERYYFLHLYDGRSEKGKKRTKFLLSVQKKLGIKSGRAYPYRGYFYCHLNGNFIGELTDRLKKDRGYLRKLKTCLIPEEFFFQNIIMSGESSDGVINDHLIYNVWNGFKGSPEELKEEDFEAIIASGKPFCRKIGEGSLPLIDKIEKYLSEER